MNGTSDFLVVGGGIWGLSTAYHLAARVRLLTQHGYDEEKQDS